MSLSTANMSGHASTIDLRREELQMSMHLSVSSRGSHAQKLMLDGDDDQSSFEIWVRLPSLVEMWQMELMMRYVSDEICQ